MPDDDRLRNFVRADWTDLRDGFYTPTLDVLKDIAIPEDWLTGPAPDGAQAARAPVFGIRDQRNSGRCAGYSLAALIDIQTRHQKHRAQAGLPHRTEIVSADMLYRMGAFHDRYPDLDASYEEIENDLTKRPEGIRSLRSVIKGFYHHGVCLDLPPGATPKDREECWQSDCYRAGVDAAVDALSTPLSEVQLFPKVAQAKAARRIGLGAYYRVRPMLNHFHAAINEAGAVLVSANVHTGWEAPYVPEAKGVITWPKDQDETGTHAFVLVGYDDQGFLALNSWGPKWGGYRDLAGVALWNYADWAENVIDAWVLRLGVSAPTAFGASIGEQGWSRVTGAIRKGSVPCYELVGHYMHLDDGYHVTTGAYPSMTDGWRTTLDYLKTDMSPNCSKGKGARPKDINKQESDPYRGLLLWIPGSLEGIGPAFMKATRLKSQIKNLNLYPYTVFWCNNFVEKSLEVLTSIFDSSTAQVGSKGKELDALIEQTVRGVGRAFWRDIERGARRSVRGVTELPEEPDDRSSGAPGILSGFFDDLLELVTKQKAELHIVTDGAGVLVLHELLAQRVDPKNRGVGPERRDREIGKIAKKIATLSLVLPAIDVGRAEKYVLPLVEKINLRELDQAASAEVPEFDLKTRRQSPRPSTQKNPFPARIYIPHKKLQKRICFGDYGKSILHLVAAAFEDREWTGDPEKLGAPRTFVGMSEAWDRVKDSEQKSNGGDPKKGAFSRILSPSDPKYQAGDVPQLELSKDPAIAAEILYTIGKYRKEPD